MLDQKEIKAAEEKAVNIIELINQRNEIDLKLQELIGSGADKPAVKKSHAGGGKRKSVPVLDKRLYTKIKNNELKNSGRGTKLIGKWSHYHDKCVMCGGTEEKHKASGFCRKCYTPKRVEVFNKGGDPKAIRPGKKCGVEKIEKTEKAARKKSKWSRIGRESLRASEVFDNNDYVPESSVGNRYHCNNCEAVFTSVLDENEAPVCEKCGSRNVAKV